MSHETPSTTRPFDSARKAPGADGARATTPTYAPPRANPRSSAVRVVVGGLVGALPGAAFGGLGMLCLALYGAAGGDGRDGSAWLGAAGAILCLLAVGFVAVGALVGWLSGRPTAGHSGS